ncbi:DUF4474 domain-containing protein [Roseburia hominis]
MYILGSSIFLICILFLVLFHYKRHQIIRKICEMDPCQKIYLLDNLAKPFGFSYLPCPDIMTSQVDAWQRAFGYQSLFDQSAPHFNMVLDCEPIYFDYDGRTWLIEFWKGQYGLSCGAEIGIYAADEVLRPSQYKTAHFHSVKDEEMLPLSMELFHNNCCLFSINRIHWWLTGFCVGKYTVPEDLRLRITLTFPSSTMLKNFIEALLSKGYEKYDLCIRNLSISFTFVTPHSSQNVSHFPFRRLLAKCMDKFLVRLYCHFTRPFTCTSDRLLYLYYFLPSVFRRILYFYKNKCVKKSRPKCRNFSGERGRL